MDRVTIAVGIGTNLGNRESHLEFARDRLTLVFPDMRFAAVHETDPVGVPGAQGPFLNTAAVGTTSLTAREVLFSLQRIEDDRGRTRPFPGAARTLDLDLILYGAEVIAEADLTVPHPRFRERAFVLQPLAEVGPLLRDPVTGLTVQQLLAQLLPGPPVPAL